MSADHDTEAWSLEGLPLGAYAVATLTWWNETASLPMVTAGLAWVSLDGTLQ